MRSSIGPAVGVAIVGLMLTACKVAVQPECGTGGAKDVLKVQDARLAAMIAVDSAALDRLLASDLVYIHSTGEMESKRVFIERLRSSSIVYRSMRRKDWKVRVEDCTGIVTGTMVATVQAGGQERALRLLFTDVYVFRDRRWQQVSWQSTRLP